MTRPTSGHCRDADESTAVILEDAGILTLFIDGSIFVPLSRGKPWRPQFIRLGSSSSDDWKEPDRSILDIRRGPVPSAPLALVPQPWRDWIADTEKATGAPADYVLQSVLAGVGLVSREDIRRRALSMSVTADETESVPIATGPAVRPPWQVNLALAETANPVAKLAQLS